MTKAIIVLIRNMLQRIKICFGNKNCQNVAVLNTHKQFITLLESTVFRGPRHFELSCGICPLPRNVNSFAEFRRIWEM